MAKCDVCKEEQDYVSSCKPVSLVMGRVRYMPIRFGMEPYWNKPENAEYKPVLGDRCNSCGCACGGFHHVGCREEACPICGEALLKGECNCNW